MSPKIFADSAAHRPAVIMAGSGRVVAFGELEDRSARIAAALHRLGLEAGDVVALLTDNAAEAFEVYWAAIRSGLYITVVNWRLAPSEVAYILHDSGAKVLIASASAGSVVSDVVDRLPELNNRYVFGHRVDGYLPYAQLLSSSTPRVTGRPRGAEMLYSSGTTGRPKGIKTAQLAADAVDPFQMVMTNVFGLTGQDVYLSPAPIYHAAPLKWSCGMQALGATVVIMERFDAEAALAAIAARHITVTQMVPTMFVRMLQLPKATRDKYDLSSLRTVVHAGAPCPPEVKDAMIDWWGTILVEYYGATEGHGSTVITSSEWLQKRGSVGRAVVGIVRICDDDGNTLPAGQLGTIYFERDSTPFEYHNDPEKTAAARHPAHDNWSTVGDIGYLDDDGYLYVTDRRSFMIISGGVNIYPQEVENVLALHPCVLDVAVIGVPDAEMGEQVKAVVQLKHGIEPSDELALQIITYVRERLAHFKAPRSVDFVERLPRTETGKLVKRELQQAYRSASSRRAE
jgi:long-chain acyl-CoA synthetase